jgi:NAD(P)H dehydrogenase (quinone)
MANAEKSRVLVTGAGGNLGRRVVELLVAGGGVEVVAGTRDASKLKGLAGVKVRRVDFDEPATLDTALTGIDRVLIISTDAIGVPGQRQRQHRAAVDAAARANVAHIVYTSMPRPEPGSLIPFAPDHYETEQAIEKSGRPFTILRNSWYAENLLGSLPPVLASGKWYTSARDGRIAYVAREDTARAAAAALVRQTQTSARFDITGPKAMTVAEIAAVATQLFGKPIEVVHVSDEQLAGGLRAAGIPDFVIPLIVGTDANARSGRFDVASDAVLELTGKPAQSVESFLRANRAALMPRSA